MKADIRVNGSTKLIGVIGNPIKHTVSPQLHNTLSSNLNHNFIYIPMLVNEGDVGAAVKGLRALNFTGFNITAPYKNEVIKHIDEISEEARLIGAVNTVKNDGGVLKGYNTDAAGFAASFKEQLGMGFEGKRVAILGAGGTARAIAVKIAMEKAAKITIINRTAARAAEIAELLLKELGIRAEYIDSASKGVAAVIQDVDIIVNTTSAGMHPDVDNCPLSQENCCFSPGQAVYDVIYKPEETKLLKAAREKGCIVSNGLGMLFYQGIYAYEIWTGMKIDSSIAKEAYETFKMIAAGKL